MILTSQPTSMTNLLSSFNNENDNDKKVITKPNINMHIESSSTNNTQNKNKRTVKKVRCKGSLVKKDSKYVPEVVCTSDNIQLPKMQREKNRDNLLKVILGEVSKNKEENESMPFEANEHPLNVPVITKKSKKPCGCRKKMKIDRTPPAELFPELAKTTVLPVNTNSNDNGEESGINNITNNNSKKLSRKTTTKRKSKRGRAGKGAKHKIVTLTVKAGEKPKIPKVKVVRKKKATKKKKPSTSSKAN